MGHLVSEKQISSFSAEPSNEPEPLDRLTLALSAKFARASYEETPLVASRALEDISAALPMRANDMRRAPETVIAELRQLADILGGALQRWHSETSKLELRSGAELLLDVERAHIAAMLDRCSWRINGKGNAAERLGMHPNTLRFRLKKLGLSRPES